MKEQLSSTIKPYDRGFHHGTSGAAPRTGITVVTARTYLDHDDRVAYLSGVRHGWNENKQQTPTR